MVHMYRRLTLVILLLLQLILVAAGARRAWEHEPVLGGDEGVVDVRSSDAGMLRSLEDGLAPAREVALKVDPDVRLVLVTQQVDWPLDPPAPGSPEVAPGGWLTYVFSHHGDSGAGSALSLDIDRLSGSIARAVEVSWEEGAERPTLPLGELPVESVDAMLAVEAAGGTAFRAECPALRAQTIITLNLSMHGATSADAAASPAAVGTPISNAPGTPAPRAGDGSQRTAIWVVTYADRGARDNVALIGVVDAVTGAVLSLEPDFSTGVTPCGNGDS